MSFETGPYISKKAPPVWNWYVLLCVVTALANVGLIFMGFWFIANEQEFSRQAHYPPGVLSAYGVMFILCGLFFAVGNFILPFLPKKPWMYVIHMMNIIAAGLSFCCLPLALPIFIFWLKPDIKEYFEFK
jgi:hypothetical protein